MAELAKDLPSLIVETDIEIQVTNIEKWLKPIMPVNGIALSLSGSSQSNGSIFGINIQENEMKKIENRLLENVYDNGAQKGNGVHPVALHTEDPIVSDAPNSVASGMSSEVDGLAIRLKYNGGEFGTLFLSTAKDVAVGVSSDEKLSQWFGSVCSSLLYNCRVHHENQENERLFKLYESVSSSLCYAGDLQELLTMIISIIVSELPSEEGSILLYCDDTNELEFFSAIGETGTVSFNAGFRPIRASPEKHCRRACRSS